MKDRERLHQHALERINLAAYRAGTPSVFGWLFVSDPISLAAGAMTFVYWLTLDWFGTNGDYLCNLCLFQFTSLASDNHMFSLIQTMLLHF